MFKELEYTFQLKKYSGQKHVGKFMNDIEPETGIRNIERQFDFVDFINAKTIQ